MKRAAAVVFGALLSLPGRDAGAIGPPAPGAASAQTVVRPDGPASVRGLSDAASVHIFSGQVSYSIPFELPTAAAGFGPKLALQYSGALGNGSVGVGWSLGTFEIRRSERHGVPSFTASDELDLIGPDASNRLIPLADGTLRVEGQGNTVRIVPQGQGFVVYPGDGTRLELGLTAGGRQEDAGRTVAWLVERMIDPVGQTVTYGYQRDQNQLYLTSIDWGPRAAFHVTLGYEPRTDAVTSYRSGIAVVTAWRLDSVEVRSFGEVLRTYHLSYDASLALSRLAQVHATGRGNSDAWPDLTFGYATPPAPSIQMMRNTGGWVLNTRGVSLLDVDGDGLPDLYRMDPNAQAWRKNLGDGSFGPMQPAPGADASALSNARLMDLDGDARAELVTIANDTWRVSKWTGAAWQSAGAWPNSRLVPLGGTIADLNGDGKSDVIRAGTTGILIHFGGDGQLAPVVSRPPISATDGTVAPGASGVRFVDVNGDGLADVVYMTDTFIKAFLGRGDGTFVATAARAYPWPEQFADPANTFLVDLDRDGIVDLLRFSAGVLSWYRGQPGFGFAAQPIQIRPPDTVDYDAIVTVADLDGNGSDDVVWSSPRGMWTIDMAGPSSAALLARIDNGLGKVTRFDYSSSSAFSAAARAAGTPWQNELPVAIAVPVRMTIDPGAGTPARVVEYVVRDGFWDASERRFGGFLHSTQKSIGDGPATTSVEDSDYLAGLGDDRVLRGKPSVVRKADASGTLFSVERTTWSALAVSGLPVSPLARRAVRLDTRTEIYEGATQFIATHTTFSYDGEGRPIEEQHLGRDDLAGDEKIVRRSYASDDTLWIRDKVYEDQLLDGSGALVSTTRSLFGDDTQVLPLGTVGRGWQREMHSFLIDQNRWIVTHASTYDALGNKIGQFENGVWRSVAYDTDGLHPVRETLSPQAGSTLVWSATWDNVQGVATAIADPTGSTTQMTYDALGRVRSMAQDGNTPHILYEYQWAAPAPRTLTHSFDGAIETITAWPSVGWRESVAVSNGAGESLYNATRLDAARWIVSGWTERDARGHGVFRGEPVYASDLPATRPAGMLGQSVTYDALGRQLTETLPTGARRTTQRAPFTATTSQDGLAPVMQISDGLGRPIHAERTVGGRLESVDGTYDAGDRLVAISLQAGALVHRFRYDSAGRLVHAEDPDIGARDLVYDDGGRLVANTNGASQTTRFEYDGAGRITRSVGADGTTFVYHYDVARDGGSASTAGRLAWAEEPSGIAELDYDRFGRTILLRRTISGHTATERTRFGASGLALELRHDDDFAITFNYDAAGRPIAAGDLWQATDIDARGDVLAERWGNGAQELYERDALGNSSRIRVLRASGAAAYDVSLVRNAYAAITQATDADGSGLDHSASFAYDAAGRLTDATLGTFRFQYGFDALQNMVSRTATGPHALGMLSGAYRHGENGHGPRQLTTIAADDGTTHLFDYDGAGRMTSYDGTTLEYDGFDQLVRTTLPDSRVVEHAYGYDGTRTHTTRPDGSEELWFSPRLAVHDGRRDHYVIIGSRALARVSTTPSDTPISALPLFGLLLGGAMLLRSRRKQTAWVLATTLAFGGCKDQSRAGHALALEAADALFFHQGAGPGAAVITRVDGSVFEERRYEPFGAPIDAYREPAGVVGDVDAKAEPYNGSNGLTDATTGFSDHGARWMSPAIGTWLQPDPPAKAPHPKFLSELWDLNPYQFVRQNPVLYWDPDGRQGVCDPNMPFGNQYSEVHGTGRFGDPIYVDGRRVDTVVLHGDGTFTPGYIAGDRIVAYKNAPSFRDPAELAKWQPPTGLGNAVQIGVVVPALAVAGVGFKLAFNREGFQVCFVAGVGVRSLQLFAGATSVSEKPGVMTLAVEGTAGGRIAGVGAGLIGKAKLQFDASGELQSGSLKLSPWGRLGPGYADSDSQRIRVDVPDSLSNTPNLVDNMLQSRVDLSATLNTCATTLW
jgi:RHS repeat-associated protein